MAIMEILRFLPPTNDWLAFKSPATEFNTNSKLMVGPGQTAICVYNGKIIGEFENGTHRLDNANLPLLSTATKKVFGGVSPYQMDVYFFNKTVKLDFLWGLKNGIQIQDPKFNVIVVINARGQMGLRLVNKQFFLSQLFGSFKSNLVPFSKVQDFFRSTINTKIKPIIMSYIKDNQVSVLELPSIYENVSEEAKEKLQPEFKKFGFELVNLAIETLEPRREDLENVNKLLHKRAEFDIVGEERYKTARTFDVLEGAANNESGGGAGMGMGLGVGLGAGQVAGQMLGNAVNSGTKEIIKIKCPSCDHLVDESAKFCPECGHRFVRSCPKCNHPVAVGSKFCSECGEKL